MIKDFVPFVEDRAAPYSFFSWLQRRYKMHKEGHADTVIAVVGKEQLGKSTWTLRTEYALAPEEFIKDGKYDLSNIVFTGNDYRERVFDVEKSIIHDDEGATHFYSRQAMGKENVTCNKALMLCGFKHNIQFILIPSFFALDSYLRHHRIHAIVKIYPKQKFKAWTFTKSTKKLGQINKAESFTGVNVRSKGWWQKNEKHEGFNEFMKKYRQREAYYKKKAAIGTAEKIDNKPVSKKDILKEIAKDFQKAGFTQKDIGKGLGISRETINKWVNS